MPAPIEQAPRAGRARPLQRARSLDALVQGYFVVAATARAVVPSGTAATCTLRMANGLLRPDRPLTIDPTQATGRDPASPIARRRR